MVKSRKGLTCVEGGKGTCYKWKEKGQCSQGDRCSLRHETQDREQKPEHTSYPSQPYHDVEVCRGREASEAKVTMGPFFDNRVDIFIHPSANLPKQKRVVSQETRLFPHYKVDEQPNKRPKKGFFPKRRESEDKGAVAVVKRVSQVGCVSQDSDALVSQGTKEFRGNPMQKVLNAIQRVPLAKSTPRHASIRDKKGPSLGKIQVKPRHQRSRHVFKFKVRSHEETERQKRCAQSKAWDLANHVYKLKANDTATFFSHAEKWVLPSGACMHMVSEKDLYSAELQPRGHRGVRRR